MEIVPSNYETKTNLTYGEKKFINEVRNDDSNKLFLVNIYPFSKDNNEKKGKHHCLITPKGVVLIKPIINIDKIKDINSESLKMIIEDKREELYKLLTRNNQLVFEEGKRMLKFPINYKFLFSEINKTEIDMNEYKNKKQVIEKFGLFRDSSFYDDKKLRLKNDIYYYLYNNIETPYLKNYLLNSDDITGIINMISPEYAIPVKTHPEENEINEDEIINLDCNIQPSEDNILIKSLRLDDEQIKIINNMRKGHQLILACAGSGKSVILLSKAMKLAKENPDKQILLTCFNKNLADYYVWRSSVAGSSLQNLQICTFHKLTKELLKSNNFEYDNRISKADKNIKQLRKALDKKEIEQQYLGIFIDEIQVFKTDWYKICYDLLESHDKDNYFFTISGDISQNLNKNIKKGEATWHTEDEKFPKYTGRSIRINKNYRNTIEINNFIVNFLDIAETKMKEYDINYTTEEEVFLKGEAFREGKSPKIIKTDRGQLTSKIIEEIHRIQDEKNYALSEVALIFPFKKYRKPINYYVLKWIKDKLEKNNIDYSLLVKDGQNYPCSIEFRTGVNLVTINSALGLDFDVVLFCGLLPMGYFHDSKSIHKKQKDDITEEMKEEFHSNINKIYTAVTRARQELVIFLDDDYKDYDSIYNQMILETMERIENND